MTELAALRLTPARAAEWVRVIELKCQWENLRAGACYSIPHLHLLQRAFADYREAMMAYTSGDRNEGMPDLSPNVPDRLRWWCRTVRAVLRRCENTESPGHIVNKAHKSADLIAAKLKTATGKWEPAADLSAAIRQLDAVIDWCDERMASVPIPAFEAG
ncbi:hypothetical protein [Zavarzinella formosa]|uniref:hypothetical protein n=1 Tax=Zavarzinella formosa TaxID=360055 RepID=UPI001EE64E2A|nr:hypothetical protein [Zavarzinella formosa]